MKKVKDFLARLRERRNLEEEEVKERVGAYGPKGPKQKGKRKKGEMMSRPKSRSR